MIAQNVGKLNWLNPFSWGKAKNQQLDSGGWPVFSVPTTTGELVNAETAMRVSTVHACVHLLSSVVASMPCLLHKLEADGDMQLAQNEELYWLLKDQPNNWMTASDYWQYNMECILLRGGFISWKNKVGGNVRELIPLDPDGLTREIDPATGKLVFSGTSQYAPGKAFSFNKMSQDEFFFANYRTLDGINPCSPIKYTAETIGLAKTAEKHGASVFKNDATPPAVVTLAEKLSPEHLANLAKMWMKGGSGNKYGMPRFLDGGAKFERIQMSNEDAQYLETRQYQRRDIAAIFGVPPSMVGDTSQSQGWSTLEQKNSDFLTYTLSPYLTNIEHAIKRDLIGRNGRGKFVPNFDEKALLRANISDRSSYYTQMFNLGAINSNEIRHAEGLNSRDGGDEYYITANTKTPEQLDQEAVNEQ